MHHRQEKMARQLQRILGEYLQTRWPGRPSDVLFSIVNVVLSPDLHYAIIHTSIFPPEKEKSTIKALADDITTIQNHLNKSIKTRPVPRLSFISDHSEKHRAEIDALLQDERA